MNQMANNQVQNVIKRVHDAAVVDECSDAAKRCRYDDQTDYGQKRSRTREESYMTMEVSNGKHDLLQDNGDMEMDVDSNPDTQSAHEQQQQQQESNIKCLQQPHHQHHQQQQQQQQQQQASVRRRHASLSTQIYQDRNNDFNTMGHEYIGFNSHFVGQKFDANNPTKIAAEFPETDVEYMYQTTHGGDFMRHLMNSYPGEDL